MRSAMADVGSRTSTDRFSSHQIPNFAAGILPKNKISQNSTEREPNPSDSGDNRDW
jgi:hypothetical protein